MLTITYVFTCDCTGCQAKYIHSEPAKIDNIQATLAALVMPEGWKSVQDKEVWKQICPRHKTA